MELQASSCRKDFHILPSKHAQEFPTVHAQEVGVDTAPISFNYCKESLLPYVERSDSNV